MILFNAFLWSYDEFFAFLFDKLKTIRGKGFFKLVKRVYNYLDFIDKGWSVKSYIGRCTCCFGEKYLKVSKGNFVIGETLVTQPFLELLPCEGIKVRCRFQDVEEGKCNANYYKCFDLDRDGISSERVKEECFDTLSNLVLLMITRIKNQRLIFLDMENNLMKSALTVVYCVMPTVVKAFWKPDGRKLLAVREKTEFSPGEEIACLEAVMRVPTGLEVMEVVKAYLNEQQRILKILERRKKEKN